jgi:hypothetical protein
LHCGKLKFFIDSQEKKRKLYQKSLKKALFSEKLYKNKLGTTYHRTEQRSFFEHLREERKGSVHHSKEGRRVKEGFRGKIRLKTEI